MGKKVADLEVGLKVTGTEKVKADLASVAKSADKLANQRVPETANAAPKVAETERKTGLLARAFERVRRPFRQFVADAVEFDKAAAASGMKAGEFERAARASGIGSGAFASGILRFREQLDAATKGDAGALNFFRELDLKVEDLTRDAKHLGDVITQVAAKQDRLNAKTADRSRRRLFGDRFTDAITSASAKPAAPVAADLDAPEAAKSAEEANKRAAGSTTLLGRVFGAAKTAVGGFTGGVLSLVGAVGRTVVLAPFRLAVSGLRLVASGASAAITGLFSAVASLAKFAVTAPFRAIGGAFSAFTSAASGAVSIVRSLGGALRTLQAFGTRAAFAIAGGFAGLAANLKGTTDQVREIQNLAGALSRVDPDTGKLKVDEPGTAAFNDLLGNFGVKSSEIGGALTQLGSQILNVQNGSETAISYFREMGVEALDANGKARDTLEVLSEIAAAQKNMGPSRGAILGQLFGEDDYRRLSPFLTAMSATPTTLTKAIADQKKSGWSYSAADISMVNRLRAAMNGLQAVFRLISRDVLQTFGPPFERLILSASGFIRDHRKEIITGLARAWNLVGAFAANMLPRLISMGRSFSGVVGTLAKGLFLAAATAVDLAAAFLGRPDLIQTGWIGAIWVQLRGFAIGLKNAALDAADLIAILVGNSQQSGSAWITRSMPTLLAFRDGLRAAARAVGEFFGVLTGSKDKSEVTNAWILEFYEQIRGLPDLLRRVGRGFVDFFLQLGGRGDLVETQWIKDFGKEISSLPDVARLAVRGLFAAIGFLSSFGPTIMGWLRRGLTYLENVDWSGLYERAEVALVNLGLRVITSLLDVTGKGLNKLGGLLDSFTDLTGYIQTVAKDISDAWAAGTPAGAITFWGDLAGRISAVVDWVGKLWDNLNLVFAQGKEAQGSFTWLNSVKGFVENLTDAAKALYGVFDDMRKTIFELTGFDIAKGAAMLGILKMVGVLGAAVTAVQILLGLLGGGGALLGGGVLATIASAAAIVGGAILAIKASANFFASRTNLDATQQRVKAELDAGYDLYKKGAKGSIEQAYAGFAQPDAQARGGYFAASPAYNQAQSDERMRADGMLKKSYFADGGGAPSWVQSEVAAGVREGIKAAETANYMRPLAYDQAAVKTAQPGQDVNVTVKWPTGAVTKIPTNQDGLEAIRRSNAFTPGM